MRIAHMTTVHRRSDVRIFQKECRALSEVDGYRVYLFVMDGLGTRQEDGVEIVDAGSVVGRLQRMLRGSPRMVRLVRRHRIDVVHFHDPELIPLGLLLRTFGYKVIYDVHEDVPRDLLIKEYIPPTIRRILSATMTGVERVAGAVLSGIVTATPHIGGRFPSGKTEVIRNFPIRGDFALSDEIPYKDRPHSLCYIGTISEARGIIEIVDAMDHIGGKARLMLAGSFNTAELEAGARRLPGWKYVDYAGWVGTGEISDILSRSRIGLVTLLPTATHLESLPVKLFEYMAAGIPVVASDFPYWRRVLEEAQADCALFVDPKNPVAVAEKINWLLDNPDTAEKMGRSGRDAISRTLNWEAEANRLRTYYGKILRG